MRSIVLADRLRGGIAEQPFGGPFQPVMVPSSDLVMIASLEDFDDRAEQRDRVRRSSRVGGRLLAQPADRPTAVACRRDIVDQQHRQHEARGAEAIDSADIKAEIETRRR